MIPMYDPNLYRESRQGVPDKPRYSYLSDPAAAYPPMAYAVPPTNYLGSPTEPSCVPEPNDRQYAGLHQSIDNLIATGAFAIPPADPVAALLSDKQHTSRLSLADTLGQIRQRYWIYRYNMSDLEQAKVDTINAQRNWLNPPGWKPENDADLQQTLESLTQLQRQERISLWQDVSRLRTSLPETIQMYLSTYRKMDLLSDRWEDNQ